MAQYRIHILRDDFTKLAQFDDFLRLEYSKEANGVGACKLELGAGFDRSLVAVDRILEVYRTAPGVPEYRAWSGLIRKWPKESSILTLYAFDWNELIKRRIVAYPDKSPQADVNGPADDLIKQMVRENLGAEAGTDRSLASLGLTVEADASQAATVAGTFAWNDLLYALREITSDAADLDDQVFYEIRHNGAAALLFRTSLGYLNTDRTTAEAAVYFAEDLGNLTNPKITYDHSTEINYVYTGGRGEDNERITEEVSETDWINASLWNRREYYRSVSDAETTAELESAGRIELGIRGPVKRVTGRIQDTERIRLGREWDFGDRVFVQHDGETIPVVVAALNVTVESKKEVVEASLDTSIYGQHWDDPTSAMLHMITSLRREVAAVRVGGQSRHGLSCDFTSAAYDTRARCHAAGIKFTDTDTPAPASLVDPVSGTWSYTDGRGWKPASAVTGEGPALMIALNQPGEFEIEIEIDYRYAVVGTRSKIRLGYVDASGHVGSYAYGRNGNAAAVEYQVRLETNDGDDTFTARYTGTATTGTNIRRLTFQVKNGALSVWDAEDQEWHDYGTRGATGYGYTPGMAFVQCVKFPTNSLDELYIKSLRLTYLSRSG